jgi:hypothetical protein
MNKMRIKRFRARLAAVTQVQDDEATPKDK